MPKQHVYVISDLHLGGMSAAEDPEGVGFQMCQPEARRRLARFIHYLRTGHPAGDARLVINGDFIDFLAEETAGVWADGEQLPAFEPFTYSQRRAVEKLRRVVRRADVGAPEGERVFEALGAFLAEGNRLDLLLGNHDIELSLPECRRYLVSLLTGDRPARLSFTYDGEALDLGPLLIEHGNRYDGWNAVAHGKLRAWRARATRGEPPYEFTAPPGSRLVTRIMNPLKRRFRFIDLLKPENEAVVPLMVALEPDALGEIDKLLAYELYQEKERVEAAPGRLSEEESYVAAGARNIPASSPPAADELAGEVFDTRALEATRRLLAAERSKWSDARVSEQEMQIASGVGDWLKSARSLFRLYRAPPADRLRRLREALLQHAAGISATFALDRELPPYLEAAQRLAHGGRTVVFGHTHLVKRIALLPEGTYLNTGTWCPTISLPPQFCDADVPDAEVLPALAEFVRDLCENRTGPWCRLRTAYAHVTIDDGGARGELCEYAEDGTVTTL